MFPCLLFAQLHLSSYMPRKAGAASPPQGRAAAHPSSVPAPKVQRMEHHRRGHRGWCWGAPLLDFCILDVSISRERSGREPRTATTGTLTGRGGNTQPRGHCRRSWREGWCHLSSTGKSLPAIGQDKPALLVAHPNTALVPP